MGHIHSANVYLTMWFIVNRVRAAGARRKRHFPISRHRAARIPLESGRHRFQKARDVRRIEIFVYSGDFSVHNIDEHGRRSYELLAIFVSTLDHKLSGKPARSLNMTYNLVIPLACNAPYAHQIKKYSRNNLSSRSTLCQMIMSCAQTSEKIASLSEEIASRNASAIWEFVNFSDIYWEPHY
ncbi:MAG: hypothetical protein IT550_12415 [Novosphingobium sp.]|nr:hypothetical protein [Novosphingobium sp.]